MPRSVFRLLWESIEGRREIFAYVKNMASNGDHYWVFAHVTPSFAADGKVTGYHSNRRAPARDVLEKTIVPLYARLVQAEAATSTARKPLPPVSQVLSDFVASQKVSYDELMFSLKSAA